jgi:CheY-like chemotaxis protein
LRILVADDNRDTVLTLMMLLREEGHEVRGAHYGTRAPLLIAISGKWNKPSEKLLAQAVGFDQHLEKPCDPQALVRLLKPLKTRSGRDAGRPAIEPTSREF